MGFHPPLPSLIHGEICICGSNTAILGRVMIPMENKFGSEESKISFSSHITPSMKL